MINILIRLHTDIIKFNLTLNSIRNQTYKNINILVSVDNEETYTSIKKNKNLSDIKLIYINPVGLYPGEIKQEIDENCNSENKKIFGTLFLPNIYLNILHQYIKPGYILYLDVGDKILDQNMFMDIQKYITEKNNIIWQIIEKQYITIPRIWYGYPILYDIDSSNIMFHTDFIENWTGYRLGDFRVIKEICKKNNNIFIPKTYIEKDHGN